MFRCIDTETGKRLQAVKRIEKLRFEAAGGKKEIEVLLHAQATSRRRSPQRCPDRLSSRS